MIRHDRAAAHAIFRHLAPAQDRCPQRLHPRAVEAGNQEQLVVDFAQSLQVGWVEDVALGIFHHYAQAVAQPAQLVAVVEKVFDVGVGAGNHPVEIRIDHQMRRLPAKENGNQGN
ncbi:hypothetical protein D3C78_1564240 [compost metagenome]